MKPPTIFPGLEKKNSNPRNEPVRNVVDGWKLSNGNLVLYVKCEDGVTREVVIRNNPLYCRSCNRATDDPAHVFGCRS